MRQSILGTGAARALLAAVTLVLLVASSAVADTQTVDDANDADGKLDIAAIQTGHHTSPSGVRKLTYTFTTHDGWSVKGFGQISSIDVHMKTMVGKGTNRYLTIRRDDGELIATMDTRGPLGRVRVTHPDRHTVRVAFPRRFLGKGVEEYRWFAYTSFIRAGYEGCDTDANPVIFCTDTAPDSGLQTHVLD